MLLVAGPPASGKTAPAAYLAGRLGWPLFSKDAIKERLFDTVGFEGRAAKIALGVAAMDLLCLCADAVLAAGQAAVLESNFERASYAPLEALLLRHGARAITVRVEAAPDVRYARFVARDQGTQRHPGHVRNDRYPTDADAPAAAPAARDAFEAGIAARGMIDFALGTLIPYDTTDPAAFAPDALEALYRRVAREIGLPQA